MTSAENETRGADATPLEPQTSVCSRPWRARLLGAFICLQVVFLPLANFIQFVPRPMPPATGELDMHIQREGVATSIAPLQTAIDVVSDAVDRYGEVSGQAQAWSLFAPDYPKQSVFPIVEIFHTEDRMPMRSTYASHLKPRDPDRYFRWPGQMSRLGGYDYLLAVVFANYTDRSFRERPDEWRQAVFDRVRQQQRSLEANFRLTWKLHREVSPHSDAPTAMFLYIQIIPSPEPGSDERAAPFVLPLARWQPGAAVDPDYLPVEAFDMTEGGFERLRRN